MNYKELDDKYTTLYNNDKQLKFARNAIKSYKIDKTINSIKNDLHYYKDKSHKRTHNNNIKRHILNIDNTSRINYEMIKNIPGNIPVNNTITTKLNSDNDEENDNEVDEGDDNDEIINSKKRTLDLIDIDIVKTKIFKNNLFEMNDSFINKLPKIEIESNETKKDSFNLSLSDQIDSLYQLQNNLLKQYNFLQNLEKKWFALREIILDANIELDLFSEQDVKSLPIEVENNNKVKVRLGSINVPASHTQSAIHTLAFNRCKRLRNNKESNDIIN
ncbi:similar to Saccharomyces cerevisiae YLR052W IES3 Subunit of the INO80 chromatin remodeling complex [Maudiozyma saulgeensis]|uniref:Similar to Saccharomyces cerevisiae YLR052W IES3 Subunit of the INO80 chromatin remodeling complex n=1 Tax=Maudiozyma saulgeensis TaxID=1789683 RepID=A0A1X7QYS3_9SACH|nr:similar to Saccharomyces cerevisiae YLR052W IES3 Subunit of the INO80 chromatin remodeling complex [Kazachstania saulgeensis]